MLTIRKPEESDSGHYEVTNGYRAKEHDKPGPVLDHVMAFLGVTQ